MKRLLFVFSLCSAAAFAQTEPSAEAMKSAQDLFSTMGLDKKQLGPMMPLIEGMARRMQLNEADTNELKSIYEAWFTQDLDQEKLQKLSVKLYAEAFTVDELKAINDFYKSPVGQKMMKMGPELSQKSTQAGAEEARSKQELLMKRLQPFMEKHQPKAPAGGPAPFPTPSAPAPK